MEVIVCLLAFGGMHITNPFPDGESPGTKQVLAIFQEAAKRRDQALAKLVPPKDLVPQLTPDPSALTAAFAVIEMDQLDKHQRAQVLQLLTKPAT
jgi:hypothetical protein